MHRNKKKRNIIIFSLVGVLLCMVAGYAAFQTQLEIKGTSKVTSNWNILITNVTAGTPTGSAENAVAPDWDKLTASMEANLYDKGDAMEYDVTIENQGTIDAKLNDILTNLQNSNSDAVLITFSGYTKGEILKAKSTKIIHVKIEYNPDYEGEETSSEVTIDFDYGQNNNETSPSDKMHLVTYDCTTNGGSACTSYNEYLLEGSNINLTHKGSEKKYYNFVGWNTNKEATSGLTTLTIADSDITLYAIYEEVDPTEPIIDNIATTVTDNSITVVVTAHDDESGIVKYEYSIDGGKTWIDNGDSNTYTFTGLTSNTSYTVHVRVTNGVDKTATSNKDTITSTLAKPTFSENVEGEVVITYPSGCSNGKTCSYQENDGIINTVNGTTTVNVGEDGTIVATVTDGVNTVSSTYTVVRRNLYVSSTGSDTTGYGTISKPYATLTKAYDSATSTSQATIYVMDKITQTDTTNMDENKDIVLTSYSTNGTINSLFRGDSLTDYMINQTNGDLTFQNITVDGNNVAAQQAMVFIGSDASIENGTTLKNANNINDYGGSIFVNGGTLTMNGGEISNNKTSAGGSAVFVGYDDTSITMKTGNFVFNSGSIKNNISLNGAVWNGGNFTMNGGDIINNSASSHAAVESPGIFNLNGGSIINNKASMFGGGVGITSFKNYSGVFNVNGGTINDNEGNGTDLLEANNINVTDDGPVVNDKTSSFSYKGSNQNYIVSALNNGYGLAAEGGQTAVNTNVLLWQNSGDNQKWRIHLLKIVNGKTQYGFAVFHTENRWLWVHNNSNVSGANVLIYNMNSNTGGYWNVNDAGNGYYYIKNINGLCLDLENSLVQNGTNIDVWTCNNQNNQKWKFVEAN